MSAITFTQTNTVEFGLDEFRIHFDAELQDAALKTGVPYTTEDEQVEFDTTIWNSVIEEVGEEYDMNDEGDADGEELCETTAGCALNRTVKEVLSLYVKDAHAKEKERILKEVAAFAAARKLADCPFSKHSLTEREEEDDWQEVYNNGEPRMMGETDGIFYQTYGNGGGPGGWGGYWVMGSKLQPPFAGVWVVEGDKFTPLDGCRLQYRSEDERVGQTAALRIVPGTAANGVVDYWAEQREIELALRALKLKHDKVLAMRAAAQA